MTTQQPECTREELMLRQAYANAINCLAAEGAFYVDDKVPAKLAGQIARPAELAVALDCWRNKMIAIIDEIVDAYNKSGPHR